MKFMKTKTFCMMVLCTGLLVGCDKEEIYEPVTPPVEKPDKPINTPSTDNIIKTKIGDFDMIVGSNDWNAVTYGNGKYVAVGQNGSIAYSSNGVNWTNKQIGTNQWKSITYGNGKFVAVGGYSDGGYVAISTDGVTWTTQKNITDAHIFDICYNGSIFVIVCHWGTSKGRGYILKSTDGVNWGSKITVGNGYGWAGICYGNGKFIAVGDNYGTSGNCGIAVSSNGVNWSIANSNNADSWGSVAYGNGKYVAVGNFGYIITSEDGVTWNTPVKITGAGTSQWFHVTYSNGKFVAIGGGGGYITSIDGITWTPIVKLKDESGKDITAVLNGICAMP